MKNKTRMGKSGTLKKKNRSIIAPPHITHPPFNNSPLNELWLDKYDVLIQMHISGRTLQIWRKEGILPYSKIRGKIYYLRQDIIDLLNQKRRLSL